MVSSGFNLSVVVFGCAILATFLFALLGRMHSRDVSSASLSEHRLNRWLVGLSAGATANSGFVVTGAVGLGYAFGVQWLLLPLSWLLGDVIFWSFFPQRINAFGRAVGATTMTDIIVEGMTPRLKVGMKRTVAVLVILCLGGYVSAQWIAGQKFLHGAFGFGGAISLLTFAALIVVYTAIGGFRGSVYVDSMQAIVRVIGTAVALLAVGVVAARTPDAFWQNIHNANPDFLRLLPHNNLFAALPVVVGFAAAALGFGIGTPQMVTRYLAGATPKETKSAWWIYNGFVQGTWISMTVFGIVLRGIMPSIADPEVGLSLFFRTYTGSIFTGLITADIFFTVAATSNSLMVAMAQAASRDLFDRTGTEQSDVEVLWPFTATLGVATMVLSFFLHSSVVNLALSSVSLLGAGLAPAMIVRVLKLRYTDTSLICSVLAGISTAVVWKYLSLGASINEAAPGIAAALVVNYLVSEFHATSIPISGGVNEEHLQ